MKIIIFLRKLDSIHAHHRNGLWILMVHTKYTAGVWCFNENGIFRNFAYTYYINHIQIDDKIFELPSRMPKNTKINSILVDFITGLAWLTLPLNDNNNNNDNQIEL